MGPYFNEKLSDEIKPGIKTGVNTGIGLNLSDHVVLSISVVRQEDYHVSERAWTWKIMNNKKPKQ